MQDGLDMLYKVAVEQFHHPIVLWCVMCGELLLGTLLVQELGELSTSILSTTVGPEAFDLDSMLSVHPCHKSFVGIQGLVFGVEDL